MPSPDQIRSATPLMQAFLAPILTGEGRTIRKMGAKRAEVLGEDPAQKSSQYGEIFSRLLRERRPGKAPAAYPSPSTAWHYADVFRAAGDVWATGPLVLYAVGQLESFVEVVATADLTVLPAGDLRRLLDVLPAAVTGNSQARRLWALPKRRLAAFWDPATASKRLRRAESDAIMLAHSRARHFDVPYDLQRRAVLDYLKRWLDDDVIAKQRSG